MGKTVIVRPRKSFYRAMTDDELRQHMQDLWVAWRFSETADEVLDRHWTLCWVELRHRGLLPDTRDLGDFLEQE